MLTIYNFSLHKSPQQGYDRQKKKCKTTISPLLTFNLKVGFTFSVLSPKACPYAMAFIFNLPCDGERDFFELEVEVV